MALRQEKTFECGTGDPSPTVELEVFFQNQRPATL